MLFGNPFGALAIVYAGLEGLGVDLALSTFRWRASLAGAMLAGALGNLIVDEVYIFVFGLATTYNIIVGGLVAVVSGAILGGLVAWLLARALDRTGVTAGLGQQTYQEIK
jgi:energy-coupling factor transport system substrate-specific component